MKNWLTIGQFADRTGFTPKALRLYEKMGLIVSHARGDNDYRYYDESQLPAAARIKELKDLGFSLVEIKNLLKVDAVVDSESLRLALSKRKELISAQTTVLQNQKDQIEKILSSLQMKTNPLAAEQRRAIMSFYGSVSIVVTGVQALEATAHYLQRQFQAEGKNAPVIHWSTQVTLPEEKPYILILPEKNLADPGVSEINPDTIVIKNIGQHSDEIKRNYLRLFTHVGAHVTSVFNADDVPSVDLAAEGLIKKSRYHYYSKNGNLEKQIKNIGGVISDGEEINLYGYNLRSEGLTLKIGKILTFENEIAVLAALGAVMTIGFKEENLMPQ